MNPQIAPQSRRLGEVDAVLRSLNVVMAGVVAASAALFMPRFGTAFAFFACVPLLYWIVRSSPLGMFGGVRMWNIALVTAMVGSIGGAASMSGGADSPVVYFVGVIALLAHALFAHRGRCAALGVGSILFLGGIDLWLGRPVDPVVFLCALVIAGYLPMFVDRLVRLEQLQRSRAIVDHLTGCLNRHALDARSIELEEQGRRTEAELAVIMFDLDHFKEINDRYGHGVGDRVLAHVANVTRGQLRRFELVYRIGGEEFAILLPGVGLSFASAIAEKIRTTIESSPMDEISVTASFGVVACAAPFSIGQAIEAADHRMYVAKSLGRNQVVDRDVIEAEAQSILS
jgi:diguanylate cyclase (GGDEF)-like protein